MSERDKNQIVQSCFHLARLVGLDLAKRLSKALSGFTQGLLHFDDLYEVYMEVPASMRARI